MDSRKDLLILTADGNAKHLFAGLMENIQRKWNIKFSFDVIKHSEHDPGVFNRTVPYIRPYLNKYRYLIVELDYEGSGKERDYTPEEIEEKILNDLNVNGWKGRCCVISINPELEQWLWGPSPIHLQSAIDWEFKEDIYEYAVSNALIKPGKIKPDHPKEAFESVLKHNSFQYSSSIFKNFASSASYKSCSDRAFLKLMSQLQEWFGAGNKKIQ